MVLAHNVSQNTELTFEAHHGYGLLPAHVRLIRTLERGAVLDRTLAVLPSEYALSTMTVERRGLTRPELAVLLAYSKMWLSDELVDSDLPEDPWVASALQRYFPRLLRETFAAYSPRHPLKREIIATHVLNRMVNRVAENLLRQRK